MTSVSPKPSVFELRLQDVAVNVVCNDKEAFVVFPDAWRRTDDVLKAREDLKKFITQALKAQHIECGLKQAESTSKKLEEAEIYKLDAQYMLSNRRPSTRQLFDHICDDSKARIKTIETAPAGKYPPPEKMTVGQFAGLQLTPISKPGDTSHAIILRTQAQSKNDFEQREALNEELQPMAMGLTSSGGWGSLLPALYVAKGVIDIAMVPEGAPAAAQKKSWGLQLFHKKGDVLTNRISEWLGTLGQKKDHGPLEVPEPDGMRPFPVNIRAQAAAEFADAIREVRKQSQSAHL